MAATAAICVSRISVTYAKVRSLILALKRTQSASPHCVWTLYFRHYRRTLIFAPRGGRLTPPFWCDYGYNIEVGESFYANRNLVITDGAKVTFGDNVFIAPNCCFTTAEHPTDPDLRRDGVEMAKPITVGNNVWIGAGSTVLAGVTIGDDAVIGAGSVVTRDIPPRVVACGVPCRVMRAITPADRDRYPFHESIAAKYGK